MTIRDDARQEAERQYPALNPGDVELTYPRGALRATARKAFERGAVWASEQAEAIDRMGPAAGCHLCVGAGGYPDHHGQWVECSCQRPDREPSDADVRAALSEWYRGMLGGGWTEQDEARMRAALLATQEVRRG